VDNCKNDRGNESVISTSHQCEVFHIFTSVAKFTQGFLYFLHSLRLFRIDSLGNEQPGFDLNVECEEIYKRVENEKSTSAR